MSVTSFCRALQTQWQTLTEMLWPESSEQRTQAEITRLGEELARRRDRLVARRRRIEQLRARLTRLEHRLTEQTSLAHSDASKLLDQVQPLQRAIERNRQRLARQEEIYARGRQTFDQRKALRLALARGEVVVCSPPVRPDSDA